jgi:hypothetical protein
MERLEGLNWLERLRLCENLQKLICEVIREREPGIPTILSPPKDKVQEIFDNNLAIIVDIPNYKRFVSDRPLIYLPELRSKSYYHESPAESYYLNEALDSLMRSISPIRILCHPDLQQWIQITIRSADEMRTILNSALGKV